MRKILIAGASGFIGHALIEKLLKEEDCHIVALSRRSRDSNNPRVTWIKCDLFSKKDIEEAMEGSHEAYYLVHSMLPGAALSQGTFYDFDLIMADNFIRAAKRFQLEHIIYLGGLIPETEELSWHLRSRLEVEQTFKNSTIKTTVLRAGLIIGEGGSSFTILERLIERLPIMICPAWTNTKSRPIALRDVLTILVKSLMSKNLKGEVYDIGGPEVLTYQDLIQKTARIMKKNGRIITLNIIPLFISRFWITLITGMPKNLVYPLVLSLKYEMLSDPKRIWPFPEDMNTSLDEALELSLKVREEHKFSGHIPVEKDVRSIQRLVLPVGRDAEWVAQEYFNWLPTFFSSIIKVGVVDNRATFYLFAPSIQLLVLEKNKERSSTDRQLLYIIGGLLAGTQVRGRLEFREVLSRQYVMAAIHDFRPALPWFIYRSTQAIIHLFVMWSFGEHLKWFYISQKKVRV